MRDHVHGPEQFNWWCMVGVRLNPLCAPFIAYINRSIIEKNGFTLASTVREKKAIEGYTQ
jgi:hypothetical protein